MSRGSTVRRRLQRLAVLGGLLLFTTLALYPILLVCGISLRPGDRLYSTSLALIPGDATLDAYRQVLFEKDFVRWLRNSLAVSLAVTAGAIAVAATAGYSFSRFRFRGRRGGLLTFLITQMFPATMLLLPLYVIMRRVQLLDSLLGLGLVYLALTLPFCVWTMKGYYDTIPIELEEAAMVDGSGRMGAFLRVSLPLAAPALGITALFAFMSGWSEFIVARVVIQSARLDTLPLGLESLAGTFQTEWANYAAGSVLVCAPVMLLFLLVNRHLVGGLTMGGVKG